MIISVTFTVMRPLHSEDIERFSKHGVLYFSQIGGPHIYLYTFTTEGNGPYLLEESAKTVRLLESILTSSPEPYGDLVPKINCIYTTHDSLARIQHGR
jgi:hypothetical protein